MGLKAMIHTLAAKGMRNYPVTSIGTLMDEPATGIIYIDGNGRLLAGSSKVNLVYLDEAFTQIRTHGAAGVVQNSWRELNDPTPLP